MKVIFTDPCYLIPSDQWSDVLHKANFFEDGLKKPLKFGRGLIIHKVQGTGIGDCGYQMSTGRQVVCDAGMFCVAEISDSLAEDQRVGRFYDSLEGALKDFDEEMARCVRGTETEEDEDYCEHCGRRG